MSHQPSEDRGPATRCNPGNVRSVAEKLPEQATARIEELGFSNLLHLRLDSLGSRKICGMLMEKSKVHKESNQIELQIKDGVSLWITQEVVQHVLGMPIGSAKELTRSEATEEYNRMYIALKCAAEKNKTAPAANQEQEQESEDGEHDDEMEDRELNTAVEEKAAVKRNYFTVANIEALAKYYRDEDDDVSQLVDTDMLVRLFFGVVLDKMLLPATSVFITSTTLEAVHNLDQLRDIDWSYLVFEHLKKACGEFGNKKTRMNGCVAVLMVVFVDCIEGNQLKMEDSCRINLYTTRVLLDHLQEGPIEQIDGKKRKAKRQAKQRKMKLLENFQLMRWEDSCYKNFAVVREHDMLEISDGQESSGNKSNLDETIDPDSVYKKHVLKRTRDENVLEIGCYSIAESTFVDCLKPTGRMHSNILHLVCNLWSRNWNNKIILAEFAVSDLLNGINRTTNLDRVLTAEKVKGVTQIFIPIIFDHHWSLVVVSTTLKKKYILDPLPGTHEEVARHLLTTLETYLQSKHNTDISGYDVETPKVEPQKNNYDCGFHVLLYIKGFEKMEISNINKEEVLRFRKKLSADLLYDSMNIKRPKLRAKKSDKDAWKSDTTKNVQEGTSGGNNQEDSPVPICEKAPERSDKDAEKDADKKEASTTNQNDGQHGEFGSHELSTGQHHSAQSIDKGTPGTPTHSSTANSNDGQPSNIVLQPRQTRRRRSEDRARVTGRNILPPEQRRMRKLSEKAKNAEHAKNAKH